MWLGIQIQKIRPLNFLSAALLLLFSLRILTILMRVSITRDMRVKSHFWIFDWVWSRFLQDLRDWWRIYWYIFLDSDSFVLFGNRVCALSKMSPFTWYNVVTCYAYIASNIISFFFRLLSFKSAAGLFLIWLSSSFGVQLTICQVIETWSSGIQSFCALRVRDVVTDSWRWRSSMNLFIHLLSHH